MFFDRGDHNLRMGPGLGAEIDQPIRPPGAKDLPGAEKTPSRAYNYWAADEFVANTNPALNVTEPHILMHVVGPLDMFENPTSQNLADALKKLGELWAGGGGVIPNNPANRAVVESVRDRINTRLNAIRGQESLLGSPELPPTRDKWLELVRKQIAQFEAMDVVYPPTTTWDSMLKLKSPSGLTIPDALEKMQDPIANIPVVIKSEGQVKTVAFKERLIAECRARQTLHNRFMQWRGGAPAIDAYGKVTDFMANNAELDPDKIETLASMMAQPGQTELVGDRVSKAFWAYRMIAHNQPYDGVHVIPNIFSEYLSPTQEKVIHDAIKAYVGNDEDAEKLGWRLAHVWREAAFGDNHPGDEARGAKTSDSDATSRLTYFEQWRKAQLLRSGTERAGGPRETLTGKFPKNLLLPLLDTVPYQYISSTGNPTLEVSLGEALQVDPQHLLRKIKWHENLKAGIDMLYALNVSDAVELFQRLIGYGVSKDDVTEPGFRKFNKLVDDVVTESVIIEEIAPGTRLGYWNSDPSRKATLEDQLSKWRHSVRRNYINGMLRSAHVGLIFGGDVKSTVLREAIRAKTITRNDSLTL